MSVDRSLSFLEDGGVNNLQQCRLKAEERRRQRDRETETEERNYFLVWEVLWTFWYTSVGVVWPCLWTCWVGVSKCLGVE